LLSFFTTCHHLSNSDDETNVPDLRAAAASCRCPVSEEGGRPKGGGRDGGTSPRGPLVLPEGPVQDRPDRPPSMIIITGMAGLTKYTISTTPEDFCGLNTRRWGVGLCGASIPTIHIYIDLQGDGGCVNEFIYWKAIKIGDDDNNKSNNKNNSNNEEKDGKEDNNDSCYACDFTRALNEQEQHQQQHELYPQHNHKVDEEQQKLHQHLISGGYKSLTKSIYHSMVCIYNIALCYQYKGMITKARKIRLGDATTTASLSQQQSSTTSHHHHHHHQSEHRREGFGYLGAAAQFFWERRRRSLHSGLRAHDEIPHRGQFPVHPLDGHVPQPGRDLREPR